MSDPWASLSLDIKWGLLIIYIVVLYYILKSNRFFLLCIKSSIKYNYFNSNKLLILIFLSKISQNNEKQNQKNTHAKEIVKKTNKRK